MYLNKADPTKITKIEIYEGFEKEKKKAISMTCATKKLRFINDSFHIFEGICVKEVISAVVFARLIKDTGELQVVVASGETLIRPLVEIDYGENVVNGFLLRFLDSQNMTIIFDVSALNSICFAKFDESSGCYSNIPRWIFKLEPNNLRLCRQLMENGESFLFFKINEAMGFISGKNIDDAATGLMQYESNYCKLKLLAQPLLGYPGFKVTIIDHSVKEYMMDKEMKKNDWYKCVPVEK